VVISLTWVAWFPTGNLSARQECGPCASFIHKAQPERLAQTSPWFPVASLVIPGTGQLLADRNRGVVYLVAEALALAWHLHNSDRSQRERKRYRDLAFTVARGGFMPAIRDTVFEYFEQMGKFVASGPFDTDPGLALVPPRDEVTFNGSIWGLARRTFFADPENPPGEESDAYQAALAFYQARAVGPNFLWSWEGNLVAMQGFTNAVAASDQAFQRSTVALALVFANHFVSTIDAHITHRLSSPSQQVRLRTSVMLDSRWGRDLRVGSGFWISF
jgi:hypothetical protein